MNLAASHNITDDLTKFSIHFKYDGTDKVLLGDGLGLSVSHIDSLELHIPKHIFILRDNLYVPNLFQKSNFSSSSY